MAVTSISTSVSARDIMRAAWARYRAAYGNFKQFFRDRFAVALKLEWADVRARVRQAKEAAARLARAAIVQPFNVNVVDAEPLSPLEAALDALKYLPAHMSLARAEADVRARFAAQG